MNREIKFRGKRIDNRRWIYGYLADESYINDINTVDLSSVEVDPDTVGQHIGLKDGNGKEIYEGDIVRHINGFIDEVKYRYGGFHPIDKILWEVQKDLVEVIGNIHDNPELLEDGE